MLSLCAAFFGGLVLSWGIETLLQPRPVAPWRRPWRSVVIHIGTWALTFAFTLMLYRRPIFAAVNALVIELILVFISQAKFKALREPFIYADFEYFGDAIRHPRLYLPFISIWAIILPLGGFALACWVAFTLEPTLSVQFNSAWASLAVVAGLAAGGAVLCRIRPNGMQFDALADLRRHGLVTCLWAYGRAERDIPHLPAPDWPVWSGDQTPAAPDLVSVQSESFFDAREDYPALRPEILAGFDTLGQQACLRGKVTVPAWGANTVRSEFAFLSGLAGEAMGVHRYQPYRRLVAAGVASLAQHLRQQGYRTVCIHPYHPTFYRRNTILPQLGFDEFVGLEAFAGCEKTGPYVGDIDVARLALDRLRRDDDRPLYLHLITMENHGPLHWETVGPDDHAAVTRSPLPKGCDDLVVYARHLRNADTMFTMLAEGMRRHHRPASLCLYGDHVPIMADVYRTLGEPSGTTPYLVWANWPVAAAPEQPLHLNELAMRWLQQLQAKPSRPSGDEKGRHD